GHGLERLAHELAALIFDLTLELLDRAPTHERVGRERLGEALRLLLVAHVQEHQGDLALASLRDPALEHRGFEIEAGEEGQHRRGSDHWRHPHHGSRGHSRLQAMAKTTREHSVITSPGTRTVGTS